ncbi:SDR family oxidoreductase (plasmid) [Sorangium sp. So ce119]|uniref:SDR family oxidoreductase n=1 Tax=Sorangium sp. So ce119 TaxID=3133279 RepID=UPI003F633973
MAEIMIITGGGRGIGAATALLAARRGYAVAVSYLHDEGAAARVVDAIRGRGGVALAVAADVSAEEDVVRLFQTVDGALGPVTALVNNAGVLERQARLEDMTAERVQRILATNVLGSFLCAREAVRRMSTLRGGRGGVIVNVSSRASQLGSPGEYIDYAASKAAIDTLTIGLAKEVAAEGIRVNAVRPGIIDTDIHASGGDPGRAERLGATLPLGRAGSPEEVAHAILWLASSESSYCTGSLLDVAGSR